MLHTLILDNTQVTDAGLKHLKGLTNLQFLHLDGTQVTRRGVKELNKALPNCHIWWQTQSVRNSHQACGDGRESLCGVGVIADKASNWPSS